MEKAVIVAILLFAYIHTFNRVAKIYFDSGNTMTWEEYYRMFVPKQEIRIQL